MAGEQQLPESFFCPLTHEVMSDPGIISPRTFLEDFRYVVEDKQNYYLLQYI